MSPAPHFQNQNGTQRDCGTGTKKLNVIYFGFFFFCQSRKQWVLGMLDTILVRETFENKFVIKKKPENNAL